MSRPLAFTVEEEENWSDGALSSWLILKLNDQEILRRETRYSADDDDAERWAADVFIDLLKHEEP